MKEVIKITEDSGSFDENRLEVNEKPEEDTQKKLKTFLLYAKSLFPFLLAHHPECEGFNNHTLKIGKLHFCIGCFVGYPSAILSIIIINLLQLQYVLIPMYLLMLGILFLASIILSPLKLTEYKPIKVVQKILIGIGSGFFFWYIWTLPNPRLTNYFLIFIFFSSILAVLNLHHAYSFYSKCKKCEYTLNWGSCPGFHTIREKLEKNNLKNFFGDLQPYSERLQQKKLNKPQNL